MIVALIFLGIGLALGFMFGFLCGLDAGTAPEEWPRD